MSIKHISMAALREHAENNAFVYGFWPSEQIDATCIDRTENEEDLSLSDGEVTPLLIDAITCKRIVSVFDAVSRDDLKAKLERMVSSSRSGFMRVADLAWRQ